MYPINANPPKCRLLVICMVSFLDQSNGLQDICYIIQPPNLSFEFLSLFRSNDIGDKQHLLILLTHL